jgi:hypothetical protein
VSAPNVEPSALIDNAALAQILELPEGAVLLT